MRRKEGDAGIVACGLAAGGDIADSVRRWGWRQRDIVHGFDID